MDNHQDWWSVGDRLEQLTRLWADPDLSCAQIGVIIGCTKSAVIGKANRANFPPRGAHREPTPPVRQPYLEIPDGSCVWPTGHLGEAGFHFCGATKAAPDKPYCAKHNARAYERIKPKKEGIDYARART